MRDRSGSHFALTTGAAPAAVLAAAALLGGLALHACKGSDTPTPAGPVDSGQPAEADVDTADTNIGKAGACIKSEEATPFPTGTCNAPKPAGADAFDEALKLAGLDRCSFGQDEKLVPKSGWVLDDPRRLPDYKALLTYPLRLPSYGRETAKWFDDAVASANPVSRAIAAAGVRRGSPVTTCADVAWFVIGKDDASPLASALIEIGDKTGQPVDEAATRAAVATLPLDLQQALAPVVRAIAYGGADVVAARGTPDDKNLKLLAAWPSWIIGNRQIPYTPEFLAALDGVDVGKMIEASTKIASTIESADLKRFAGLDFPPFELQTSFGALVIHGKGNDEYKPGSMAEGAALVIDTGGNDTYRVPVGAGTLARPVSILVDLGGKDTYGYVEKKVGGDDVGTRLPSDAAGRAGITLSRIGREGSGVLGVGLLYDFGTDGDTYRSLAISQGAGILGVGVLFDEGGNDDYGAEVLSQGAGGFGVGLLLDRAGDDKYAGYSAMQGFGSTKGVGALVDLAGKDSYFVNPGDDPRIDPALKGDPLYPNAQLPEHGNTSMSQGCGQGRRWDTNPTGYQKPEYQFLGGLGILRDAAGDDTYVASVFAQGAGFLGMGMLIDGGGNDVYEGLWYVQGATAHMAIALFLDHAGNDQYDPKFPIAATSIGVGHDFSSTVHLDEGGDDTYIGPGLALGSGYSNGLGVLVNVGGNDSFRAAGAPWQSMGGSWAGEVWDGCGPVPCPRGKLPTYGVFVKAGGSAKYYASGTELPERIGGSWSTGRPEELDAGIDAAKSTGVDRPSGTASLP